MENLKETMRDVLENNILSYWLTKVKDEENGGFYGRVDGNDQVHPVAEKGAVMNARILWAFSAAYRVLKKPEYLEAATRAKEYVRDHFLDREYGGIYWSVDYKGNPLDTKKQTYAIGFAIYGFSEYARATGDKEALDIAISLYHDIEQHAFDAENNGYIEALTREWNPIADMRLSDKDENGSRTMNTHLHIIEPYTNLYRVWKTPDLEKSIRNLLDIFTDKLLNKETYHLDLFFNDEWEGKRNIESYGHDIEASWLLHEIALVLDDKEVLHKIERIIRRIADAADEGLRPDGSMVYEHWKDGDKFDLQRQWWVQCENIIGHIDLYQYFRTEENLLVAISCWNYVAKHLLDAKNNGYIEALTREWNPIADMRLSDKDENGSRTMNTHLHIIEPYTNLYRVWKTPELEKSIRNLLDIFTDKLLDKETYHLDLFFNDEWEGKRNIESYGHDIEASWLLHETALVLDDKILLHKIERIIRRIADAADEGLRPDGSMVYEHWKDGDKFDLQRQWWVQCENIIGHIDLYQYFRTEENLLVAISCWNYVAKHLLDAKNGEWHWAILEDGTVNKEDDKAGFWKCPYHNSRMCLELIERDY